MTDISIRNENFRTTILSLHSHSYDSNKLRFISPDVICYLFTEMEKPHDQITGSCFRVWLC